MAEVTYYFNSYAAGEAWPTTPGNAVDGNTGTFASANTTGQTELLDGNQCAGTNLGAITKVELRAYGYVQDGTRVTVGFTPVFAGGNGTTRTFNNSSAAWTAVLRHYRGHERARRLDLGRGAGPGLPALD